MITILKFQADWCNPCKVLSRTLMDAVVGFDCEIEEINIEDNEEKLIEYNIKNIPTLLFIKDGKIVAKVVGSKTKDQLLDILHTI